MVFFSTSMVVYPRVLLKVTFAVQTGWWSDQEPTEQQRNRDNQESMIKTPDSSQNSRLLATSIYGDSFYIVWSIYIYTGILYMNI